MTGEIWSALMLAAMIGAVVASLDVHAHVLTKHLMARRGASSYAAEHTLAAYTLALE